MRAFIGLVGLVGLVGCATAPRRNPLPMLPPLPVLQIHQGYGRTMPMLVAPSKVVTPQGVTLGVALVASNTVAIRASQLTAGHAYRLEQGHLHGTNWMDATNFLASADTWCITQAIQIAFGPAPFPGPLSQLDTNPPSGSPSGLAKVFRLKDVTP